MSFVPFLYVFCDLQLFFVLMLISLNVCIHLYVLQFVILGFGVHIYINESI